jgi:hypothetical protein
LGSAALPDGKYEACLSTYVCVVVLDIAYRVPLTPRQRLSVAYSSWRQQTVRSASNIRRCWTEIRFGFIGC